jgi:hypothetical protein
MTDKERNQLAIEYYKARLEGKPRDLEVLTINGNWVRIDLPLFHNSVEYRFAQNEAERKEEDRLKQQAELKAEWEKEKFPVEFQSFNDQWIEKDDVYWYKNLTYRRKPQTALVPFCLDDIDMKLFNAAFRINGSSGIERIWYVTNDTVCLSRKGYISWLDFLGWSYSTDLQTWHPCGKLK